MQLRRFVKVTFLASSLLTLYACGGGSSGASTQPNTVNETPSKVSSISNITTSSISSSIQTNSVVNNKISQGLVVTNETTELEIQQTFSRQLQTASTGTITYSSSNTAVATVDNNGLITAVGTGSTQITVNIAGDDKYLAASASYTIKVKNDDAMLPSDDITMSAWIGEKNTLTSFPASANGFTFYSSSDSDCDFTHVANCTNGQFDLLNGLSLTNTATTLNHPGNYLLEDSNDRPAFRMITKATFEPRIDHQVVNFNNSLWLVGGYLGLINFEEPNLKSDVWSSNDGISWAEQTASAGFSTRIGHRLAVFNNTLWLIGGNDSKTDALIPGDDNGRKNDIWSSADGINWTQQVSHASFSPRADHSLITFNNKLWLIGGNDKTGNKNDVWSSSNGITWVKQTSNASFSARSNPQVVVFHNKLWLIGNNGNDVWSSSDGIKWLPETLKVSFSSREDHKVVVHNNKLWLIAGYDKNDVWSSSDGITWTQQTEHAAFSPRNNFQLVSYDNKLVISGGSTKDGLSNEIWSSTDGIEWRKGFSGTFQFAQ